MSEWASGSLPTVITRIPVLLFAWSELRTVDHGDCCRRCLRASACAAVAPAAKVVLVKLPAESDSFPGVAKAATMALAAAKIGA